MSTAIAPRDTQIQPLDVAQTRALMETYQRGLEQIVSDSDYQEFKDRGGETRKFLKRSGWRKIATWFGLDLQISSREIDRDERGKIIRAHVVCRAVATNGRYADGDGGCSIDERRFSKPEHDIPAVATTRATNRAISNLVGMGSLSFEELSGDPDVVLPAASYLTKTDADKLAQALQAQWPDVNAFEFLRVLRARFVADGLPGVPTAAGDALDGWLFWNRGPADPASEEPVGAVEAEFVDGVAEEAETGPDSALGGAESEATS